MEDMFSSGISGLSTIGLAREDGLEESRVDEMF